MQICSRKLLISLEESMAEGLVAADSLGWNPVKHFLNQVSSLRNVLRTVVSAGQHFFEIASWHVVQLLNQFDLCLVDLARHLN